MVGLNKPVIIHIDREHKDWLNILTCDGNAEDANAITKYVTTNGVAGVMLGGVSPYIVSYSQS